MAANENVLTHHRMKNVLAQTRARHTIKNFISMNQMSKTSKSYREKYIREQTVLENFFDKNIWDIRGQILALTYRVLDPHVPQHLHGKDYERYKKLYRFSKRFVSIIPLLDKYNSQFKTMGENMNIIILHKNVTKLVNDLIHYNDSFIRQFMRIDQLVRDAVKSARKMGLNKRTYPYLELATSDFLKRALKYSLDRLEFKDTSPYHFPVLPNDLRIKPTRRDRMANFESNSGSSSSSGSESRSSSGSRSIGSNSNRTRGRGVRGRTVKHNENGLLTRLSKTLRSFF
jgi:hypothetical protein